MFGYLVTGTIIATIFLLQLYYNPAAGMILQRYFPNVDFQDRRTQYKVMLIIVTAWPAVIGVVLGMVFGRKK